MGLEGSEGGALHSEKEVARTRFEWAQGFCGAVAAEGVRSDALISRTSSFTGLVDSLCPASPKITPVVEKLATEVTTR